MRTIEGYDVKIFTDRVEDSALEQIARLLSIEVFGGCKIRIMPDVHAGAGCVIGFTGDLGERVIPNIVGVDIGCGIRVQPFRSAGGADFHALNEYIRRAIPSGRDCRGAARRLRRALRSRLRSRAAEAMSKHRSRPIWMGTTSSTRAISTSQAAKDSREREKISP